MTDDATHDIWAPSEEAMAAQFDAAIKSAIVDAALTVPTGRTFPKPRTVIQERNAFVVVDAVCFQMCHVFYEDGSPNPAGVQRLSKEDAKALAHVIAESDGFAGRHALTVTHRER